MVYFTHSLTSPEIILEFVEEFEGFFYYRIYCDRTHPIFRGLPEGRRHPSTSYAIIYHKEKGFRFMEESDLFKRGYEVGPWLFFMISKSMAMQKCRDRTPTPGLFRQYTSNKFDSARMDMSHTRELLKETPHVNINGHRLGQTKMDAFRHNSHGKYQFYNNLVVTPVATHYHSPPLDMGLEDIEGIEKIGKRKRERTMDDMGLHFFPQNYATSAEYYIQCGDHALSITYSDGFFY